MTPINRDDTQHGTLYVLHAEALQAVEDAVAAERERVRRALMDMQAACTTHNYYKCAAVAIFGQTK